MAATPFAPRLTLAPLFCHQMVVQQGTELVVWGRGVAGATVSASLDGRSGRALVDEQGRWRLTVAPPPPGTGYSLVLESEGDRIEVGDVACGEVWLCSGQSNMVLPLARVWDRSGEQALEPARLPLRFFMAPDRPSFLAEQDDLPGGRWVTTAPETLKSLSALGYFFAVDLARNLSVPVGIILVAVGGAPIEAFLPDDALATIPGADERLRPWRQPGYPEATAESDCARAQTWMDGLDAADPGLGPESWVNSTPQSTTGWSQVELPCRWSQTALGASPGSVWFFKEVLLTAEQTKLTARVDLGTLIDADRAWVNGVEVGTTGYQYPPRRYSLPEGLLREGSNSVVVRQLAIHGSGGSVEGKPMVLRLGNPSRPEQVIDLSGPWAWRRGATAQPLAEQSFPVRVPGALFRGMLAPLLGGSLRGVVWYQGESDVGNAVVWETGFQALVAAWRARFRAPTLPFVVVQLAGFLPLGHEPEHSAWAELRQAQWNCSLLPGTSIVTALDLGEFNDLHPERKKELASRIGQQVLESVYRQSGAQSPPRLLGAELVSSEVVLRIASAVGGLKVGVRDEEGPTHLQMAAADRRFFPAQAVVEGSTVRVSSTEVPEPRWIRHGWGDCPDRGLLCDRRGQPLPGFELAV